MHEQVTWIIAASNAEAKIYKLLQFPKVEEIAVLEHPESRLHNRDLVSSEPGRAFDRGGVTRHSYQSKSEPKQQEADKFAKYIDHYLATAFRQGEFLHLYVLASPNFLGLLRQHMDPHVVKAIVAEIPKDLSKHRKDDIEQELVTLRTS